MRRSEACQGVRVVKFRSALDRNESSELNQIEAAKVIGASWRHLTPDASDRMGIRNNIIVAGATQAERSRALT